MQPGWSIVGRFCELKQFVTKPMPRGRLSDGLVYT